MCTLAPIHQLTGCSLLASYSYRTVHTTMPKLTATLFYRWLTGSGSNDSASDKKEKKALRGPPPLKKDHVVRGGNQETDCIHWPTGRRLKPSLPCWMSCPASLCVSQAFRFRCVPLRRRTYPSSTSFIIEI